jgi:hypothetical protein
MRYTVLLGRERATALAVVFLTIAILSTYPSPTDTDARVYGDWDWEGGKRTLVICLEESDKCPPNLADSLQAAIDNWNEKLVSWELVCSDTCEGADITVKCGGISSLGKIHAPKDAQGNVSGATIRIRSKQATQWGYCNDKFEVVTTLQHELGHAMRLRHGGRSTAMRSKWGHWGHTPAISADDSTEAATSDGNTTADADTDGPGTQRGQDYFGTITPSPGSPPFNFSQAIAIDLQAYRPSALSINWWSVTGEHSLDWNAHVFPHADDTEAFKLSITYQSGDIDVRQGYLEVVDPPWDMLWQPKAIAPPDTFLVWPDTFVTLFDTLSTHPNGRDVVDFWWEIDDEVIILGDSVVTTGLEAGEEHTIVLHAMDHAGMRDTDTMVVWVSTATDIDEIPLARNYLDAAYPNPFNPMVTIRYGIAERTHVSMRIYNIRGQLVKTLLNETMESSQDHTVTWNGLNDEGLPVASGVYFCRMITKGFADTKKLILLK